jgi:hypothetical protein
LQTKLRSCAPDIAVCHSAVANSRELKSTLNVTGTNAWLLLQADEEISLVVVLLHRGVKMKIT